MFRAVCVLLLTGAYAYKDGKATFLGYDGPYFDTRSGYLNATGESGKEQYHFYLLTESQSATPDEDPLILWLNGGPGCSSVGGLFEELGPVHPRKDGKSLYENIYAWNKVGNVFYMDSPAGVGFSYIVNGTIDTDDDKTADANYAALKDFFEIYPKYVNRSFYITGESYGGIYIPTLVSRVVDGMNNGDFKGKLEGFAVGNGLLSTKYQENSVMYLQYYRGIIGYKEWEELGNLCGCDQDKNCDWFSFMKMNTSNFDWISDGTPCGDMVAKIATTNVQYTESDPYNQYQDCYKAVGAVNAMKKHIYTTNGKQIPDSLLNYDSSDPWGGFPCWQDNATTTYLTNADVKKSLNIADQSAPWAPCNNAFAQGSYTRQPKYFNMSDTFHHILESNTDIRALIYNGDVDSVCNFLGDEWFMRDLAREKPDQLNITGERSVWHFRGQKGGFVESYGNRVDLLTVQGSGHFVPTDKPGPALQMIANFIRNTGNYSKPFEFTPRSITTTTSTVKTTTTTTSTTKTTAAPTKAASLPWEHASVVFALMTSLMIAMLL